MLRMRLEQTLRLLQFIRHRSKLAGGLSECHPDAEYTHRLKRFLPSPGSHLSSHGVTGVFHGPPSYMPLAAEREHWYHGVRRCAHAAQSTT